MKQENEMNSTGARRSKQRGFALLTVLILLLVISAVAAGIMYSTIAEQSNAGSELQKNTAYYASEAAMEKMTADLGTLYTFNKAPGITAITGLTAPSYYPSVTNATFQEYSINVAPQTPGSDVPASTTTTISSGSNAGLVAQIIKMRLQATSQTGQAAAGNMAGSPGQQVRMTRDIEVALIPVFQFGVFSDSDLSFFPGPQFDFNPGRIFTNGNLFLSAQSGPLTFGSKVQAVGEVVRDYLANGVQPGVGGAAARSAAVNIPTAANGCTPGGGGAGPACRPLAVNEESMFQFFTRKVPNTGQSPALASWTTVSTTIYHGNLQNGSTGVTKLSLPFVGPGVSPFEIIRRPPSGEVTTSTTSSSRLFNQAQIRILLDDNPANLPGGQRGTDINLADYTGTVTGVGSPQFMAQGIQLPLGPPGCGTNGNPACTAQSDPWWVNPSPGTLNRPWPLISGWLRVEYRDTTGAYNDITQEWLNLGFARQSQESVGPTPFSVPNAERGVANTVHPNAILLFQYPIPAGTFTVTAPQYGYYPINMYDPREGEVRDTATAGCAVAGVMNIIELDMDNLRKWLSGAIPGSGGNVETSSQNGYIVYYSDRRGMQLDPGVAPNPPATELNGEYGFEDVINIQAANGVPNGALDAGEDVNGNGVVDTYGVATMGNGFGLPAANINPYTGAGRIGSCLTTGRANRVTGPRHAIRAVNGSLGHLPLKPDGTGGTTIASENPVYVQGNYNANAASDFRSVLTPPGEVAAAVIADAVTLLSVNYTDLRSLANPTALGNRPAATSFFRLAIAGGKNINFTAPQILGFWTSSDDFGTDGGVHNFLRYVEDWNPKSGQQTSNYLGSLVSFYYSRQAVGVFKCCTVVYGAPKRDYAFDQNFLDPAKLPPGTPRFQDIDNLGYHQDFSPQ
jgi:Tfp pilus assembly protein PilX